MATDSDTLIALAREQLERSYAPYSGFHVAAAVVDDRGRVFTGVNVENVSYGLSMCAERAAIFAAVAAGARRITALAVAASGADLLSPCGACRQVVAEFAAGSSGAGSGLAFRLLEAGYRLNIPRLFAALVLLSVSGIAIYGATSLISWLLLRKWHESAVRREN